MNMVHAILAVLRIIGIVLLIILCALMALLCLILFVPLQYRVSVKYKDGDNEVLQKAQITWLFHLLSVREKYENGHFCYELRLFGKKLHGKGSGARHRGPSEHKKSKPASVNADGGTGESGPDNAAGTPGTSSRFAQTSGSNAASWKKNSSSEDMTERTGFFRETADKRTGFFRKAADGWTGFFRKAADFLTGIIPVLFDILCALFDGADRAEDKISSFREKTEPFISENARDSYAMILARLKNLLYHYRIRKAEGYIRYGFDNPALTGKAAGILYLLLPADSEKFDIKPDFQEKGLDVNAVWRGHIRLNHLAAALLSLFIKKQFREFLKGIKHRGGNRNG